jgi:hypothetical protein
MCADPSADSRQNRIVKAVLAGSVADQCEPLLKAQLRPLGLAFDPNGTLCTWSQSLALLPRRWYCRDFRRIGWTDHVLVPG